MSWPSFFRAGAQSPALGLKRHVRTTPDPDRLGITEPSGSQQLPLGWWLVPAVVLGVTICRLMIWWFQ